MNEHQALFVEEASELFNNAYDILLPAEEADALETEAIDELFRIIHTIKGSSGGVEFDYLCRYTHALEDLLERLREGAVAYQSGMASFFVDALDGMQDILSKEMKGRIDTGEFDQSLKKLEQKAAGYKGEGATTDSQEAGADEGFVLFDEADFEQMDEQMAAGSEDEGFVLFDEMPEPEPQPASPKPPQPEPSGPKPRPAAPDQAASPAASTIRVDLGKVDELLNRVGELVITNAMLSRFPDKLESRTDQEEMSERLMQLERHIRDLQDAVMSVRMVPMEHIYGKFPKVVRDISRKLDKKVRFVHYGDSVEIDKMMIEGLVDPLMHIVRNALDHGLEGPDERKAAGKDPTGTLSISAMQENGQMVIAIEDDGRGIDAHRVSQKALSRGVIIADQLARMSHNEQCELIFSPGLSTAEAVSDISGRGVGMDVVKNNIAKLGGIIRLKSKEGVGTRLTIILPLTLAILDGLNVRVGQQRYILPLSSVVESLQPPPEWVRSNGDGSRQMLMLRERFIPIVRLHTLFSIEPDYRAIDQGMLIVVRAGEERVALFVDEFQNQQQVVIKSLERNFRRVAGVGGATVQGDGTVSLILDPLGLVEYERKMRSPQEGGDYDTAEA